MLTGFAATGAAEALATGGTAGEAVAAELTGFAVCAAAGDGSFAFSSAAIDGIAAPMRPKERISRALENIFISFIRI